MDNPDKKHYRPATGFDRETAGENMRIAVLPILYERALMDGKSEDEARAKVASRLSAGDSFEVIRHQNTTAVIVHQPSRGKISVAYDGTEELRDKIDNIRFSEHDHPLGGKVHKGHFMAIATQDNEGRKLSDRVKASVEQFAAEGGMTAELTMTGHSRGGALSLATTADWMAGGMPKGTKLTDVQTFGALPYGNEAFTERFMEESTRQGARVTRVIAGNDEVPTYMASKKLFTDMYTHGGDVVYLLPAQGGAPAQTLVNPDGRVLDAARTKLPGTDWHHPDTYADMLGVPDAKLPPQQENHPYKNVPEYMLQSPQTGLPTKLAGGAKGIIP